MIQPRRLVPAQGNSVSYPLPEAALCGPDLLGSLRPKRRFEPVNEPRSHAHGDLLGTSDVDDIPVEDDVTLHIGPPVVAGLRCGLLCGQQ